MVLTAIPCIDLPEGQAVQKSEIVQSQGDHHHHNDKDGDHCSPLCTCNCCASPVIQQDFTIQFDGFSFLQECISSEYTSEFVFFYCHSIWQPPQLS